MYLLIAILIIIILWMYNRSSEHMCNTNHAFLKNYIAPNLEQQAKRIKLKWVDPQSNAIYYLGAVPKALIDPGCRYFDHDTKNAFTQNYMIGTPINPDKLLVLVNIGYIQKMNSTNNVSSKFDESMFDFILTQYHDTEGKPVYRLTHIPPGAPLSDRYVITYTRREDETNPIGQIKTYGSYIDFLSILKQTNDVATPIDRQPKSMTWFYIQPSETNKGGFKIYFDKTPIFSGDNKSIIATAKKYVGISSVSPCENSECALNKCGSEDVQCLNCCSMDHRYLFLYDRLHDNKDEKKTLVITFIPEDAGLFRKLPSTCRNDCAMRC